MVKFQGNVKISHRHLSDILCECLHRHNEGIQGNIVSIIICMWSLTEDHLFPLMSSSVPGIEMKAWDPYLVLLVSVLLQELFEGLGDVLV